MAATFTKSPRGPDFAGKRKIVYGQLLLDNSYPTGGYALTPGQLGVRKIHDVEVIGGVPAGQLVKFYWDRVNSKLMGAWTGAVVNTDFDEVANATNLSTYNLDIRVTGE